jgi:hypothetical protein
MAKRKQLFLSALVERMVLLECNFNGLQNFEQLAAAQKCL